MTIDAATASILTEISKLFRFILEEGAIKMEPAKLASVLQLTTSTTTDLEEITQWNSIAGVLLLNNAIFSP